MNSRALSTKHIPSQTAGESKGISDPGFSQSRRKLMAALAAIAATPYVHAAGEDTFPQRPITIVVGFAAGGGADLIARDVAKALGEKLRQPVIIDNKPGAGGTLAAQIVARAPADGYTLLLGTAATLSIAPHLYKKLAYNSEKDFAPIAHLASNNQLVLTRSSFPAKTPAEFIAALKAVPGKYFYGTAGNGSTTHLVGAQFAKAAGVTIQHVPYRGLSAAYADLLAGNIDFMFDGAPSHMGRDMPASVKAIASTGVQRELSFPQVPTLDESALKGFVSKTWYALFAPARTPSPIIGVLNTAVNQVLQEPTYRKRMSEQGYRVEGGSADALMQMVRNESSVNARLIRDAHISID